MRHSTRFILAATFAAGLVMAALPSSSAAFTSTQQACRSAIAKNGGKFAKTALKAMTACHKTRDSDGTLSGTDCNDITMTPSASKVTDAEPKFGAGVAKKCTSGTPAAILYEACPAPCDSAVPAINTYADVVDCLVCLTRDDTQNFSDEANGTPTSPLSNSTDAACHGSITKNTAKMFNSAIKSVAKCQASQEKLGLETTSSCTDVSYSSLVSKAHTSCFNAVYDDCNGVTLPSATLDACGSATTRFDLATCVCDAAKSNAKILAKQLVDLSVTGPTTTTSTTTTLLGGDPTCPDVGELLIYSKMTNQTCSSNADCSPPHFCDMASGRCETVADLDSGWTGLAHDSDINDGVTTRAHLFCPGPGPTCGECNVTGIDPSPGNCRCANNIRTICTQPFQADASECGGATCNCYFGAPFPLNSAGTAVCVVNRFAEDVTGTANVDLGSGAIRASLRSVVYTGFTEDKPCPVCGGKCSQAPQTCTTNNDCTVPPTGKCTAGLCSNGCIFDSDCGAGNTCIQDTPNDGVRNGICIGDTTYFSRGATCDVNATNASFPPKQATTVGGSGGGGYSIDCQPDVGKNVSGTGLAIVLNQTTGTQSMGSAIDCDGAGPLTDLCPCLACTKDQNVGCTNNGDCVDQGNYCSACVDTRLSATQCSCVTNTDCSSQDLGKCGNLTHTCQAAPSVTCTTNADCTVAGHKNAGTCTTPSTCTTTAGGHSPPQPNQCTGGLCNPDGSGGEGICASGPIDKYCDGLVRADGSGMVGCTSNASCTSGGSYGTCSQTSIRQCFLDPIVATGSPDPLYPVAGSVFCIAPTANPGINDVAGLPGPGRVTTQSRAKTFCASNHAVQYTPGSGLCPP